jgi:hypothetical protein
LLVAEFCEERVVNDMVGGAEVVQALLETWFVNDEFGSVRGSALRSDMRIEISRKDPGLGSPRNDN